MTIEKILSNVINHYELVKQIELKTNEEIWDYGFYEVNDTFYISGMRRTAQSKKPITYKLCKVTGDHISVLIKAITKEHWSVDDLKSMVNDLYSIAMNSK